jgi:subtilisin family serine protease
VFAARRHPGTKAAALGALLVLGSSGGSADVSAAATATQARVPAFAANRVLAGFHAGVSREKQLSVEAAVGARELSVIGAGTHVLQVPSGRVLSTVAALDRHAAVRYAEPDWLLAADQTPNDPGFGNQWALFNTGQTIDIDENTSITGTPGADIKATAAWDVTTGTAWDPATAPSAPVVGVIDTGLYYNHPDLAGNVWSDPLPFNFHFTYTDSSGVKRTDTVCPAGSHGWDAIRHICDPYDPAYPPTHGSSVAGIIGARGNNGLGVAGVNWRVSLMGVRWDQNSCLCGYTSQTIEAIDYAVQAKQAWDASGGTQGANVRVLSNSYGCCYPVSTSTGKLPYDAALLDEVRKAGTTNILFVASAGNSNYDINPAYRSHAHYPCSFDDAGTFGTYDATTGAFKPDTTEQSRGPATNVICVASSDYYDQKAGVSNWGTEIVQLAAPGSSIYTTDATGSYRFSGGTSSATPHVSGVAALVLSQHPTMGVLALKQALVGTYANETPQFDPVTGSLVAGTGCECGYQGGAAVDQVPSLQGLLSTGGGRLDACRALDNANQLLGLAGVCLPGKPRNVSAAPAPNGRAIIVSWSAPTSGGLVTGYRVYRGTGSGRELLYKELGNVLTFKDTSVTSGVTYYYKVSARHSDADGPLSDSEGVATAR